MWKLAKLGIFVILLVSLVDESRAYYSKPVGGCSGDSECGNYCYYGGPGAIECCIDGSIKSGGACSGSGGQQQTQQPTQQQTCTDNGQRTWRDCDAPEPSCGQRTEGRETAIDNCGATYYQPCAKEGAACPVEEANVVNLPSSGGVGNKVCRDNNKGSCVKIQSKNNNRNEWRDASEYTCSSNIGGSGYRAVCSESGGTQITTPSGGGITRSGGVAATLERKEVTCTSSEGVWDQQDPVTGEGCGKKIRHICPENRNVEDLKTCTRIIDFEITSCYSCTEACTTRGYNSGSCYSGTLPIDAEVANVFWRFGNYGCNTGQQCYCYNSAEVPRRVNIVSSGTCSSVSRGVDLPQRDQQTRTNVVIGGVCSNDPECESGFCNEGRGVCVDECNTRSLSQCKNDNKCVTRGNPDLSSAACLNKVGDTKLVNELAKLASSGSDPGTKYDILIAIKRIMEDYNLNFGEYVKAWESENSELRAGIPSPALSGHAVRINTATEGCPDFVSNSKVDFDDFFRFVDEFGKVVNRDNANFDLEKDDYGIIGLGDFFKFADNFGKEVECFTATCTDNEANLPGEILFGRAGNTYSCGGECGLCNYDRLNEVGVNALNINDRQGSCEDGICTFNIKASGRYQGRDSLNLRFKGSSYGDKNFNLRFSGDTFMTTNSPVSAKAVLDITTSAVNDLSELRDTTVLPTLQAPSGRSRLECGLQLNPGFCCPAGYTTSSDGSRCVLVESRSSYCADFNSDSKVDFIDYFYILDNFGTRTGEEGYDSNVDLDKDGQIGFGDFFIFADEFGSVPNCGGTQPPPVCGNGICDANENSQSCYVDCGGVTKSCSLGEECFLKTGDRTIINDRSIRLSRVGSGGAAIIIVDGLSETISAGNEETIYGIKIKVEETFYDSEDFKEGSATLIFSVDVGNTKSLGSVCLSNSECVTNYCALNAGIGQNTCQLKSHGNPCNPNNVVNECFGKCLTVKGNVPGQGNSYCVPADRHCATNDGDGRFEGSTAIEGKICSSDGTWVDVGNTN